MDQRTHDLIVSALEEDRLAAVHIDLEKMYGDCNERTFRAVGGFSQGLRDRNIPNIWVTFPCLNAAERIAPGISTVGEFNRMANDPVHNPRSALCATVGARDHETVVIKDWGSALHTEKAALHECLQTLKKDTILIDGVAGHACVARTIDDGTLMDRYNFIAVPDCINLLDGTDYETFMKQRGLKNPSAFSRRFYTATSGAILKAIETPKTVVTSIAKMVLPPYPKLSALSSSLKAAAIPCGDTPPAEISAMPAGILQTAKPAPEPPLAL